MDHFHVVNLVLLQVNGLNECRDLVNGLDAEIQDLTQLELLEVEDLDLLAMRLNYSYDISRCIERQARGPFPDRRTRVKASYFLPVFVDQDACNFDMLPRSLLFEHSEQVEVTRLIVTFSSNHERSQGRHETVFQFVNNWKALPN